MPSKSTEQSPLLAAPVLSDTCPHDAGACGSSLLFSWLTPLLDLGNQRPLQFDDLYQLNPTDRATNIDATFQRFWAIEAASPCPRMWRVVLRAFGGPFLIAGLLKVLHIMSQFVGPLLIKSIVAYLSDPDATQLEGLMYAGAIFAAGVLQSFALRQYYFKCYEVGLRLRTAVVMSVYQKALRLGAVPSTGQVTNLMSLDAQRLQTLPNYAHAAWFTLVQVSIAFYLMYVQLGVAFAAGIAVTLLLLPISSAISRAMRSLQTPLMHVKDVRLKVIFEVLSGIKVLKLQAWEPSYLQRILSIRCDELRQLRSYVFAKSYAGVVFNAVPSIVTVVSFAAYVYLGNTLDVGTALTSVALFEILRSPLNNVPEAMNGVVEGFVSFGRLEDFYGRPERVPVTQGDLASPGIELNGTSFMYDGSERPALAHLDARWGMHHLVAVVGAVGSGKSSLLHGLLGNVPCTQGQVYLRGTVAYVGQQPFIQNATLRDNITFGLPFDVLKYKHAVSVCSLQADLAVLPGGDLTEIGEKGINLSGGQRTRVALARAVYMDADIYLLDDPLAAVDAHVGADIFKECIGSALKEKLVVLVTNALQFLKDVDSIVVLNNGAIVEAGPYASLVADPEAHPVLSAMLASIQSAPDDATDASMAPSNDAAAEQAKRTAAISSDTTMRGDLIADEDRAVGNVPWTTYAAWLTSCGGYGVATGIVLLFAIAQVAQVSSTLWLSYWSMHADPTNQTYYLLVFVGLNVLASAFILLRSMGFYMAGLSGSKALFESVLATVLRAPMSFFDTTPLGRVMNRLSKDVYTVDESIPYNASFLLSSLMTLFSALTMTLLVTPLFGVALLPLTGFYYMAQRYYVAASCELQRMDATSRSPVYALLTETLDGLATIRASKVQAAFIARQAYLLDRNQRAYFLSFSAECWLGLRVECIGALAAATAVLLAVLSPHSAAFASVAGVSLSYSFNVAQVLNWTVRFLAIVQTQMVSVERLDAYQTLATEADWTSSTPPPQHWPASGRVVFDNVDLRYREGLPRVLRTLSFALRPNEKVGVVGRTGAGKSSLVVALMRLVELSGGRILLDGVDIAQLGLHELRGKIAIIPQDPVLFSGSIRSNLDPFGRFDDDALWVAIKRAHLEMPSLDVIVDERGLNFSVGERQLLCIARALLKKAKVILMDEATASIDPSTDRRIQESIRTEFVNCTTLTIAHRINTILDCDRVLVMDKGAAAEFDAPSELLKNPNGLFTNLVDHWRETDD
ncbi:hypothetical protein SDRG_08594 [Saprolegnia diclina VS20]|uniref:Uncharacterized protein n=1 Tax=Saprolegnia diclina (strain VS20) TaxID=1156394 RepID=T0Q7R7_SAPDV|nr:hypothetical protein SDRG_08594 [Saprolegnia diclina VS20]EQC33914.1 hypothetical protein SDRG_08594 [Saprolegnia diclina VS20]|eukprot:XP_008612709.1 hypothetical protein SDRG_08594 [Saprolegnia diclina VS20]